jgi:hypothetical protein
MKVDKTSHTLEDLEKLVWANFKENEMTPLIKSCNELRKKPLMDYTIEDLRIMISQEVGLYFLMPLAMKCLEENILAEGDFYKGDLLKAVLEIDSSFWLKHPVYFDRLKSIINSNLVQLHDMKFDLNKFTNA